MSAFSTRWQVSVSAVRSRFIFTSFRVYISVYLLFKRLLFQLFGSCWTSFVSFKMRFWCFWEKYIYIQKKQSSSGDSPSHSRYFEDRPTTPRGVISKIRHPRSTATLLYLPLFALFLLLLFLLWGLGSVSRFDPKLTTRWLYNTEEGFNGLLLSFSLNAHVI